MTMAGTSEQDFKKFKDFAKTLKSQPIQKAQHFNPESVFKDYSTNPEVAKHYKGVQSEQNDLSVEANTALKNDMGGRAVVENFGKQQIKINQNNDAIKQAQLIEDESHNIVRGKSNEQINCDEAQKKCKTESKIKTCYSSRLLPDQTCTKKRKVTVSKEKTQQTINFSVTIPKKWTGQVTVNLMTGAVYGGAGGNVSNLIKLNHPCEQMNTTVHSVMNNGQNAYWVTLTQLPSCANGGVVSLYVSKEFSRYYPIQVSLTVNATSKAYIATDEWINGCLDLENSSLCHIKKEQCSDENKTRVVDGLPVTRECWEKTQTFSCASAMADECIDERKKGCFQVSSRCTQFENGACNLYEQTYRCEEQSCKLPVACTKNLYCVDGDCTDSDPSQNQNFGENVSALAAVSGAGSEYKEGNPSLFSGKAVRCKIWPLDIIDCCSDKGWGKALNLTHCRDEDKALGQAKLDYKAHYLGKYCSKRELGICIEHKRTYCVYDSKLARIIQEEGRLKQLGEGVIGTAENPNCSGLTPEELQRIDMGKIDFVSPQYPYKTGEPNEEAGIAADMAVTSPKNENLISKASERIKERMEGVS